jgi:hypothetical protein
LLTPLEGQGLEGVGVEVRLFAVDVLPYRRHLGALLTFLSVYARTLSFKGRPPKPAEKLGETANSRGW